MRKLQPTCVADRRRVREAREAFNVASSKQTEPGDVYRFRVGSDIAMRWVVINNHPDQPDQLFVVPADEHPLSGPDDLLCVDKVGRRITLYCGLGLWLPRSAFLQGVRTRFLSEENLGLARDKISQVTTAVRGKPGATGKSKASTDYKKWMDLVAKTVKRLAMELGDEPGVSLD